MTELEELSSKFVQMDLYGEVSYHVITPLNSMQVYVGVQKDFEKYLFKHEKKTLGIALIDKKVCFVFIEKCVKNVVDSVADAFCECWDCVHGLSEPNLKNRFNTTCKFNHDQYTHAFMGTIISVVIHELIHLCGCYDHKKMAKIPPVIVSNNWACPHREVVESEV